MLLVPAALYIKFGTCVILGNKGDPCLSIVLSIGLSVMVYTVRVCACVCVCTYIHVHTYRQSNIIKYIAY